MEEWMLEITKILHNFKNSETTGTDDLPKDFYVTFWDHRPCWRCVGNSYRRTVWGLNGSGPQHFFYMKGARKDLENCTPIILLNFDCKLWPKFLAKCFKSVTGTMIHEDIHGTLWYQRERGLNTAVLNFELETLQLSVHWSLFETLKMGAPQLCQLDKGAVH